MSKKMWPSEVFGPDGVWRTPDLALTVDLEVCATLSHSAGVVECEAGHPQVRADECDGVHCHRACDEDAHEECKQRWLREVKA